MQVEIAVEGPGALEAYASIPIAYRAAEELDVESPSRSTRHGFILREIRPAAYPDLPNEVQLLWYKDLA